MILNPTDDMKVMQEEIFGPLLPVKGYRDVTEAVDYINAHDRPLGLYYFGSDDAERDRVLNGTTSGGVTVNDVVMHVAQEELPFGGIGPAGMGAYHGHDGFREFSHRKSIYHQIKRDLAPLRMLRPPYGAGLKKYLGCRSNVEDERSLAAFGMTRSASWRRRADARSHHRQNRHPERKRGSLEFRPP